MFDISIMNTLHDNPWIYAGHLGMPKAVQITLGVIQDTLDVIEVPSVYMGPNADRSVGHLMISLHNTQKQMFVHPWPIITILRELWLYHTSDVMELAQTRAYLRPSSYVAAGILYNGGGCRKPTYDPWNINGYYSTADQGYVITGAVHPATSATTPFRENKAEASMGMPLTRRGTRGLAESNMGHGEQHP